MLRCNNTFVAQPMLDRPEVLSDDVDSMPSFGAQSPKAGDLVSAADF